jgi:hypothetical protein
MLLIDNSCKPHHIVGIAEFLGFVHHLAFWKNTMFRKLDPSPLSGEGRRGANSGDSIKYSYFLPLDHSEYFAMDNDKEFSNSGGEAYHRQKHLDLNHHRAWRIERKRGSKFLHRISCLYYNCNYATYQVIHYYYPLLFVSLSRWSWVMYD